jgi:hypothetical protein
VVYDPLRNGDHSGSQHDKYEYKEARQKRGPNFIEYVFVKGFHD